MNWSFLGSYEHVADEKGRVAIPRKYREKFEANDENIMVITKFIVEEAPCLEVYPQENWHSFEAKLAKKSHFNQQVQRLRNFYVSNACETSMDKQGRILLPPELRRFAGIDKKVMFTGDVGIFRMWDLDRWHEVERISAAAVLENPSIFEDLGF